MTKFFIPLGYQYGRDVEDGQTGQPVDPYSHMGSVYGPYEGELAVKQAMMRLWPNNKDTRFLVFDGDIINVPASALERPEADKRAPGDFGSYIEVEGGYECKDCGATIQSVAVAHSVHIKGFSGAGFGEVRNTQAPYCPNCERKPSSSGEPVYEPF